MRSLIVLPEATVVERLNAPPGILMKEVEDGYRAHWQSRSVCPHSMFLRFPDRPRDRIIALPSYLRLDDGEAAGIKWISSFPDNASRGLRRASALIVLNDNATGYPIAVMEGAAISACRTAGMAAMAARHLAGGRKRPGIGVVGAGRIAETTVRFLGHVFGEFSSFKVYDLLQQQASGLAGKAAEWSRAAAAVSSIAEALDGAEIALFATTAGTPHVTDPAVLRHCRLVLHISLRDLSPEVLDACCNVVDDREHVLRERTSLHLHSMAYPERDVIAGSLGDFIWGNRALADDRPIVFSPFGLGVLDLALARFVMNGARELPGFTEIPAFFEG